MHPFVPSAVGPNPDGPNPDSHSERPSRGPRPEMKLATTTCRPRRAGGPPTRPGPILNVQFFNPLKSMDWAWLLPAPACPSSHCSPTRAKPCPSAEAPWAGPPPARPACSRRAARHLPFPMPTSATSTGVSSKRALKIVAARRLPAAHMAGGFCGKGWVRREVPWEAREAVRRLASFPSAGAAGRGGDLLSRR